MERSSQCPWRPAEAWVGHTVDCLSDTWCGICSVSIVETLFLDPRLTLAPSKFGPNSFFLWSANVMPTILCEFSALCNTLYLYIICHCSIKISVFYLLSMWKFGACNFCNGAGNFLGHLSTGQVCFKLQWSLWFKTAHSAGKIWSYIEGGLKLEGYLYWKYTSGVTDIRS